MDIKFANRFCNELEIMTASYNGVQLIKRPVQNLADDIIRDRVFPPEELSQIMLLQSCWAICVGSRMSFQHRMAPCLDQAIEKLKPVVYLPQSKGILDEFDTVSIRKITKKIDGNEYTNWLDSADHAAYYRNEPCWTVKVGKDDSFVHMSGISLAKTFAYTADKIISTGGWE